jgi:hypothetical protein
LIHIVNRDTMAAVYWKRRKCNVRPAVRKYDVIYRWLRKRGVFWHIHIVSMA